MSVGAMPNLKRQPRIDSVNQGLQLGPLKCEITAVEGRRKWTYACATLDRAGKPWIPGQMSGGGLRADEVTTNSLWPAVCANLPDTD